MSKLWRFWQAVLHDPRIPMRNWIALGFLALWIVSPIDFIVDWLPLVGQLDDMVALLLIVGYLFDSPDSEVLLEHWPWSRRGFLAVRGTVRLFSRFVPAAFKRWVFRFPKPGGGAGSDIRPTPTPRPAA
jgi:uncharacterized membrane protein YkvA (DUF1232 family)